MTSLMAHPPGYELDDEWVDNDDTTKQARVTGGNVGEFSNDIEDVLDGAEVVYAKSWGGKQFYGAGEKRRFA